ncbi:MAG: hypothetical protein U9Q05_04075 [Thermodesulfobacteriota bacterium]|nr:hypothetical protein [Thermodesulfobacteriota bacterium]
MSKSKNVSIAFAIVLTLLFSGVAFGNGGTPPGAGNQIIVGSRTIEGSYVINKVQGADNEYKYQMHYKFNYDKEKRNSSGEKYFEEEEYKCEPDKPYSDESVSKRLCKYTKKELEDTARDLVQNDKIKIVEKTGIQGKPTLIKLEIGPKRCSLPDTSGVTNAGKKKAIEYEIITGTFVIYVQPPN